MNWQDRITSDPHVCHGKPCIKGTRVMVSVVIDNLAAGESHESIIQGYNIKADDIQAALRYAAEFDTETMAGHLWIVDEHQVRIRPGDPPASP